MIDLFLEENNTGPSPARVETGHLPPAVVLAIVGLNHAEITSAIVAAHSEEFLAEDADPDGVPAYGEAGHHGPGVRGGVEPLHTGEPALLRVAHRRGVMAPHGVEVAVEDSDRHPAPPPTHVGQGAPLVGVRVVALHSPQAGRAVPASNTVQLVVQDCHPAGRPLALHGGDMAPGASARVEPLHRVEVTPAVVSAHGVERPAQHTDSQAVAVGRHGRDEGPAPGGGVVTLHCVQSLQAVPPSHYEEFALHHRHAELEPAGVHGGDLLPSVGPGVVLLYAGGALVAVHPAHSVKVAHCGLPRRGSGGLE